MYLTPTQKGGLAELEIAAAAADLGIVVSRPMLEGRRYDLIFDVENRLLRVQCKSARRQDDVVAIQIRTNRHTPGGYVRGTYSSDEIDGVVAYCAELRRCFYIPIEDVDGQGYLHLRLAPARNRQVLGVKMAADYPLGAVAQLGERRAGSA